MTLNDVCELIVDCPHTTAPDEGTGYPLIRTPNVGRGRLLLDDVHRVSEKVYKERTQRATPRDGDLIFAREAPAGNVALIVNGEKVCLGQRTVLIRPDQAKVDPAYLTYYLLSPQKQHDLLGTANGATVAHVNLPVIRKLPVSLPELKVQRHISGILTAYDNLIENNQKQIKLLEEAAQRLYKEWFVDLRFPGYENTKIADGVPEGWAKRYFADLCDIVKDNLPPAKIPANIPYIGLEHMPKNRICLSTWGKSDDVNSNKTRFKEDDILFGKIRPYFHKVGFALTDGVSSTDAIVMRAKVGSYWAILLMVASSDAFVDYTYQTCKEGAKMPRADWKEMSKYTILIPPQKIRIQFEQLIFVLTRELKVLAIQNRKLVEARDRLLPKLMSGEIEV